MTRKRKSDTKPPASPKPELGRGKKWAFRIIALVVIPLLLFGGLEAGLRIVGFGYPTKALIERDFNGKRMCFPNAQFSWRFFPHQMARDFDDGLAFEKKKAPGTFRIFVLGGSAARGTPDDAFNFGRLLEAMLGDMYPGIHFEVFNAALTAINSHVVLEITKDCAEYDPDLFIIYLGNNEVVGPFGPGTVLTPTPPTLPMIRANIAVKSTRTGQLLDTLMESVSTHGKAPKQWEGMAMFLDKQVRPDSHALELVYRHFEKNLQDIYGAARRSGAKVIVSSVGANLRDCPPFGSLHRENLSEPEKQKWEAIYQEGAALETKELYGQAIERYTAAAAIDDTFAELQFRLGRCYWEAGDYTNARTHYQSALQDDTLRFRSDKKINDTIRKTAQGRTDEGIFFADSAAAFEEDSPHQVPGSGQFYEHVHLNFHGNYVLARTIFASVQQMLPSPAKPGSDVLTESQVAHRIAYTAFDETSDLNTMYRDYLNKPPFTHQLYHDDSMKKMKSMVEQMRNSVDLQRCLEQYDQAIKENPNDWRLLLKRYELMYAVQGESDLKALEMQLRQIANLHPYDDVFHTLGRILLLEGRFDESEDALNRALFINPASGKVHFSLAVLFLKRGDREDAIRHLRQGIALAPAVDIQPYRLLATQYDNLGKTDRAIRILQGAIDIFPKDQAAMLHCHVGELLNKQGRRKEALEHMEMALRINPELAKDEAFKYQYALIKGQ
ncbi:MAG TPA: tetratricopeptide repeat protein [bacterium]|nr:tetratricopeptide repeat protein [bacterium]